MKKYNPWTKQVIEFKLKQYSLFWRSFKWEQPIKVVKELSRLMSLSSDSENIMEVRGIFNPFLPRVRIWSSWKQQKNFGYLFSGGPKGNIGKKS